MAFYLNVGGPQSESRTLNDDAPSISDLRHAFRFRRKAEYFDSPSLYVTTAMLTFFLGLTLASLRLGQNIIRYDYDMAPVGSIAVQPQSIGTQTPADARPTACK